MGYSIVLESFEGPMDLLYHLIEKNKIDLYDIPIAEVTDQYIDHIDAMEELNLDVTSEFILMASTLLEIKSKMLLPKLKREEEEEDPREDLVKKLIEYKKYKLASTELKERNQVYDKVYYRLKEEFVSEEEEFRPEDLEIGMLLEAYRKVVLKYEEKQRRSRDEEVEEKEFSRVQRDDITIEEGMKLILDHIKGGEAMNFERIFEISGEMSKNKLVTVFIALLELIKRKEVKFTQDSPFADVILSRRV
jgi:segregation and condensation protein A